MSQWPGQKVSAAPQASNQPQVQTIYTAPDPQQDIENARAAQSLNNSNVQTGLAVEDQATKRDNTRFQRESGLRGEYQALPEVKSYRTAVRQVGIALKTPATPAGDNSLIAAIAQLQDPLGSVREGDVNVIQGGQPAVSAFVENLKKNLGAGGMFTDEYRDQLRQAAINRLAQVNQSYNQFRRQYSDLAKAENIDPIKIVGKHDGEAYFNDIDQWIKARQKQQQPQQPPMGGGGIGGSTPENPFPGMFDQNGRPLGPEGGMAYDKDGNELGLVGSVTDTTEVDAYNKRLDDELARRGFDPNSPMSYADRFTQGGLLGFADEIYGLQGGAEALFGNRGVGDGYTFNRDLWRRGEEQQRAAQGGLGTAAELAGGLVTGFGGGAAKGVAGLARQGAIQGGVAGFGYGEGVGGSLAGAAGGAALGAGTGALLGKGGEMLAARAANRATRPLSDGGEVIAAADRLNDHFGTAIRPIPADVGQQGIRNATGAAAKMPISAALIGRTRDKVTDEAEKAAKAIAAMAGTAESRPEIAGEAAIEAANSYIKRSKTKVDALYTKARTLAGGERVTMPNAQQQLQAEIANLGDTPGGANGVSYLEELVGKLDGDWPVDGVKRFRKQIRDKLVKDGLTNSEIEAAALRVVDAADEDITAGLVNAGKADAAKAYAEASAAAAERYKVIDEAIKPFIGNSKATQKSGEDVIKAIEAATANKSARLGKFMSSIPAEDAANLRATLIDRIGRPSKGAETAETTFSLDKFLTNWNGMTDRAKSSLFGGELRAALDDLARVAGGRKEAGKSVNFSNTGGPVGWVGTVAVPGIASVLDAVSGAVLASPSFARWLAKMPSNPALAQKHVAALSRIAANDNVIAADVAGLQQELMGLLGQRAAASSPNAPMPPVPSGNGETAGKRGEGQ